VIGRGGSSIRSIPLRRHDIEPVEPVTAEPPPWSRRSVLHQRWDELAYFHWPYEPDAVQRLLPPGVRVDTFDGQAWVGLIPFEMRKVRLGPTPPVPYLGDFIEVNVRTYVVDPLGRRAVWFFSLDVPRSMIVGVARTAFALPYCFAHASHTVDGADHRYELARRWPHRERPTARLEFRVGDLIPDDQVTDLDHFLTARWALVTTRFGRLQYGQVHHPQWPLHRIESHRLEQDLIEAAGLPAPVGEPFARYSPGVPVDLAWFQSVAEPT
jgi:uncharacterized protein YqjF (DUF2071 family)